jgi:hypothetical protein
MFWIGQTVQYQNDQYIVCDVDRINYLYQIGKPDNNNIVWDRFWVSKQDIIHTRR